jgi:hypothetical protein
VYPRSAPAPDSLRPSAPQSGNAGRRLGFRTDIAFVSALALGLYMLAKCYAGAHFSLTSASALLTTSPVNVLLGSLTLYAYQLFPMLSLAGGCWFLHVCKARDSFFLAIAAFLLTLLAVALSPLEYFKLPGLLAAAMLGYAVVRRSSGGHLRRLELPATGQVVVALFVIGSLIVVVTTLDRLWVPIEAIELHAPRGSTERPVVIAHVLSSDGTWTSVIRAGDRGVMRVRTDDIVGRRLCHLRTEQPTSRRPIWWRVINQPYKSPNMGCRVLVQQVPGACLVQGSQPESDTASWPQSCNRREDPIVS